MQNKFEKKYYLCKGQTTSSSDVISAYKKLER